MASRKSTQAPEVPRLSEPGRSSSGAGPKRAEPCVALCVTYRADALLVSKGSKHLPPASALPSRALPARSTQATRPRAKTIAAVRSLAISMTTFDDLMESFND